MNDTAIKESIREQYGAVAKAGGFKGAQAASCGEVSAEQAGCGCGCTTDTVGASSKGVGYTDADLGAVPEGANLGLGCGNPTGLALIREGDTVLDLGSGGGFDSFLAANRVGETGRVIGVDMTPEMIAKATENARKGGYGNVEFRLGEIEHLPIADNTVDAIISNCVINLSPDKQAVYNEAHRVLKPGGRFAVSDIVAVSEMPEGLLESFGALTGCVAGASQESEIRGQLEAAGFTDIQVKYKSELKEAISEWAPGMGLDKLIASASITAVK